MTVTATQGGSTSNGMLLRVEVLTGAAASQPGATVSHTFSSTTTTWTQSITTTQTGSRVYGAAEHGPSSTTADTPNGATTMIDSVRDITNNLFYSTFKATSLTGTPGPTTLGFTASGADTGPFVMMEILTAGSLAEDGSAPAVQQSNTVQTLTTASFTPPAGSLIVALVSSDGGSGVTTMTVSGGGLIWTEQVKSNTSLFDYAGIWTASIPGVVSIGGPVPQLAVMRTEQVHSRSGRILYR